jgi:soluble lytic murein transglycosylase
MRARVPLALALALAAAGCAERRFAGPPPPGDAPPPGSTTAGGDEATTGAPSASASAQAVPSWIDSVRLERWGEAAARIDALPEAMRERPEVRYARARAALGTGDGARALALLDGLDGRLPLLAQDIARARAEAQLLAGPYAAAAAYFARSGKPSDLVRAAGAYERAGDTATARATVDRAVAAAQKLRITHEEAAARAKRAEILRAHGGEAAAEADLHWLVTHAPGSDEARVAAEALDKTKKAPAAKGAAPPAKDPAAAPAPAAEHGPAEAAEVEPTPAAERVAKAPPPPRPPAPKIVLRGEAGHQRAMDLWHAREWADAADAFREAALSGSAHAPEDLFYAGRSLSRADRDEDAIRTYHEVVRRWPRSVFADRAAYYAARLDLLDGRYADAAKAYAQYLAAFKKGEHRDDAEYERALALVSSGGAEAARAALAAIARRSGPDRAARVLEIEGVAALRAGDRAGAVSIWTDLARSQPLTWAAMASRARLAEVGAPLPPLMDPPPPAAAPPRLDLRLPAEAAILASVGLDGDAEVHLAAAEREVGAAYPGREGEALCGIYGLLSRARRRFRIGQNAVDGAILMRTPSERDRWAWECVYPEPFASGVHALEEEHGLPRGLVYAVMRQESAFDPFIVSPASAVGLMQLMPATAKQAAIELSLPYDEAHLTQPDVNLRLGAFYIAKLLRMFQGSVVLAAAAYNAGPKAVSRWIEAGADNDLDLWVARIPFDETRTYVARVTQNLSRYQWLEGGDVAVAPVSLAIPAGARAPADAY